MSKESTTPPLDLAALMRRRADAGDKGDVDAMTSFFASHGVFDSSPMGLEVYEGQAAIRRFFEEWWGSYEAARVEAEEIQDLGNGVTFTVFIVKGRPIGSSGDIGLRYAAVTEWVEGKVVRDTNYTDIEKARAVAERLTQERG